MELEDITIKLVNTPMYGFERGSCNSNRSCDTNYSVRRRDNTEDCHGRVRGCALSMIFQHYSGKAFPIQNQSGCVHVSFND